MSDVLFWGLTASPVPSLDVLYGVLGISKLQFFIKKRNEKISAGFFQFLVIKTLDPYPNPDSTEILDPDSINPDPQNCFFSILSPRFSQNFMSLSFIFSSNFCKNVIKRKIFIPTLFESDCGLPLGQRTDGNTAESVQYTSKQARWHFFFFYRELVS